MDQSLFEAKEALIANSFCTIVSRRVKLLYTKKIRFELFLCIRNMKDKKLVLGNYSYILEKLTFLRNFAFLLVFWGSSLEQAWNFGWNAQNFILTYFHASAYLEINSAHAQISENAKSAAVKVSFCPLNFFDKLYDLYFKWIEKSAIKAKQLIFYDIRKRLDIPYRIGHIITKVRRVDLVGEDDVDLFLPRKNNNFIMFPVSNETVNRYMKIIKVKSASFPKNLFLCMSKVLKA